MNRSIPMFVSESDPLLVVFQTLLDVTNFILFYSLCKRQQAATHFHSVKRNSYCGVIETV